MHSEIYLIFGTVYLDGKRSGPLCLLGWRYIFCLIGRDPLYWRTQRLVYLDTINIAATILQIIYQHLKAVYYIQYLRAAHYNQHLRGIC